MSADHPHLLSALRDELDITSPKDGCSPSGQCGCCTVLVDGKAVVSCNLTLDKVAGKSVVTLEGVDSGERDRFAEAFAACGGLQCGFCIPGIVMRAKSQIDKKGADLDRTSMAPHLGAHLCRCTGYVKILDAIEAVAAGKSFEPRLAAGVGESGAKYEAGELALGDRGYVDDIRVPGTHARRARVRRTRPGRRRGHRHGGGHRGARRGRRVHRRRHPGRAARRHHLQGLAGDDPGRRPHVVRRRRAGDRGGGDPTSGPLGGGPRRGRLPRRCPPSPTRSPPSSPAPSWPCGAPTTTCCRAAPTPAATSTAPSPPAPTPCTRCSRPNASSTPSSNPSRRSPCPPTTPTPASGRCTCTPAGRACGTTATTSAARSPCRPIGSWWSWCRTAVPSAARRT